MARRQLAGQHGHTLDATALVHEAYLKLVGRNSAQFDDRAHFFAYAASAMRSVVVDYARQRLAQKRGGTTLRDFISPDGQPGYFELELAAYGRAGEPCPRCGKPMKEASIGQRTTVWCNRCQR